MTDDMKDEYDFSSAERGRFFRKDAVLVPPGTLNSVLKRAQLKGQN